MTIIYYSRLVGTIAIFLLYSIMFYIGLKVSLFRKVGRVAILWTTFYIFELFFLRLLSLIHIGTLDELTIISGFSALIPLIAVIIHIWLVRKVP